MSLDPDRFEKKSLPTENHAAHDGRMLARPQRRVWLWALSIFFGGGFLCLLICCGAGAYLLQNYGSVVFEQTRAELNQSADLRDQIGKIESLTINFPATVEESKTNPEFMILKGQAETGPVELSVKISNAGELEKAFLVLPDESRRPIELQPPGESKSSPSKAKSAEANAAPSSDAPPAAETKMQPREAAPAE